ncbi:hypothetical protein IW261DRAFT_1427959 [Armillaria novae-zelandiae]|uniref:Uncharacterized protein n=1 Tax=Armillaria novae-zelandiae TaxID=153914 RepID=A0AA39NBZ9_9AGAR|nr:hypothetical protein IW261DRAFT_1427959 [Armillaria novae-zelandiae]
MSYDCVCMFNKDLEMWAKIDATCSNTTEMPTRQQNRLMKRRGPRHGCERFEDYEEESPEIEQRSLEVVSAKCAALNILFRGRGAMGTRAMRSSPECNYQGDMPPSYSLCEHANYTYMKELQTLLLPPTKNMVRGLVIQCTAYGCDAVRKACKVILDDIVHELRHEAVRGLAREKEEPTRDAVFPVTQGGHLIPVSPIFDPPRLFTLVLYILELLIHLLEQTLGVFQRMVLSPEPGFLFDTFDAHSNDSQYHQHLHRLNTVHVEVDVFNDISAALR